MTEEGSKGAKQTCKEKRKAWVRFSGTLKVHYPSKTNSK